MPVNSTNDAYDYWVKFASVARIVEQGEASVKAYGTDFLPKPGGLTDQEYQAYKRRASFVGAVDRTVQTYRGLIFRKEPIITVPDLMNPVLEQFTLGGETFDNFAKWTAGELINPGRIACLVDWNEATGKPYVAPYVGERLINWRTEMVNGVEQLVLAVLEEYRSEVDPDDYFKVREVPRWRCLKLEDGVYTVSIYEEQVDTAKGKGIYEVERYEPNKRGQTLDFIPLVIMNPGSISAEPVQPRLMSMVNIELSWYNTSADLEHALHFTALPTPYVTGVSKKESPTLAMGSSQAWMLPQGADAGILEFTGQGVTQLREHLKHKEQQMARLGARLLDEQPVNETATAAMLRATGEHSTLIDIVRTMEDGFNQILEIMSWWLNAENPEQSTVEINTDFIARKLSPNELDSYIRALQAGAIDTSTFVNLLAEGETYPSGVDLEEKSQTVAQNLNRSTETNNNE